MNPAASRSFGTSAKKVLQWVGASDADILVANPGAEGQNVLQAIKRFEKEAEDDYGDKAAYLKIQGTKLHKSTNDPAETTEVVTMSVHTRNGTRLLPGHAREDGTITKHESRAGAK